MGCKKKKKVVWKARFAFCIFFFLTSFVVELLYMVWCLLSPDNHKSVY